MIYFMQYFASLVPYTALASFIVLGILSVLLILVAWFATKSVAVTAATAAATVLPLTTLYVLDAFVCKWGAFEGLISLILMQMSPFKHFYATVGDKYFDLFGIAVTLSFTAFFLLLTAQSLNRRRRS